MVIVLVNFFTDLMNFHFGGMGGCHFSDPSFTAAFFCHLCALSQIHFFSQLLPPHSPADEREKKAEEVERQT
jgi:hypothetical protein